MLPAVPITAFVLTFLYGYLLLGMHSQKIGGKIADPVTVDPALPLLGALLLSVALGALCVEYLFRLPAHHRARSLALGPLAQIRRKLFRRAHA